MKKIYNRFYRNGKEKEGEEIFSIFDKWHIIFLKIIFLIVRLIFNFFFYKCKNF